MGACTSLPKETKQKCKNQIPQINADHDDPPYHNHTNHWSSVQPNVVMDFSIFIDRLIDGTIYEVDSYQQILERILIENDTIRLSLVAMMKKLCYDVKFKEQYDQLSDIDFAIQGMFATDDIMDILNHFIAEGHTFFLRELAKETKRNLVQEIRRNNKWRDEPQQENENKLVKNIANKLVKKIANKHALIEKVIELFGNKGDEELSHDSMESMEHYLRRLHNVQQHENYKIIQATNYHLSDEETLAIIYFCEYGAPNNQMSTCRKMQANTGKWRNLYNHLYNAVCKLHKCFHFAKSSTTNGNLHQQLYFGINGRFDALSAQQQLRFDTIISFTTGFGVAYNTACGNGDGAGFVFVIDDADKYLYDGTLVAADVSWISIWGSYIVLPTTFEGVRELTKQEISDKGWQTRHSVYITLKYNDNSLMKKIEHHVTNDMEFKEEDIESLYGDYEPNNTMITEVDEIYPSELDIPLKHTIQRPQISFNSCNININPQTPMDTFGIPKRGNIINLIKNNIFNQQFVQNELKAITYRNCSSISQDVLVHSDVGETYECTECEIKDKIIDAQHEAVYHSTMGYMLLSSIYDDIQTNGKNSSVVIKKRKQKQHDLSSYDPKPESRGKGMVRISWKLRTYIISRVKTNLSEKHLAKYMDKSMALQLRDNELHDVDTIGSIKVVNFDFHDRITDELLFCVIERQNESTDKGFKWKMQRKLFTKFDIMNELNMEQDEIPKSSRNQTLFIQQINDKDEILKIMASTESRQKMMRKTAWHKIKIFGVTEKNRKKRKMTLSLTKQRFIQQITSTTNKKMNLIPILMFDSNNNPIIEYLWIVTIDNNINIAISLKYDHQRNTVRVIGIHLNKYNIYEQHILVSPQHQCDINCLDLYNFQTYITDLEINVDFKDYKRECIELKKILSSIANTSIIDHLLEMDVNKIIRNGELLSTTDNKQEWINSNCMQCIDLSDWIIHTLKQCDCIKWNEYWYNFKYHKVTDLESILILYQQFEQNRFDDWIELIPDNKSLMKFLAFLGMRLSS